LTQRKVWSRAQRTAAAGMASVTMRRSLSLIIAANATGAEAGAISLFALQKFSFTDF
jgi:hypothetical protein